MPTTAHTLETDDLNAAFAALRAYMLKLAIGIVAAVALANAGLYAIARIALLP